MVIDLRYHRAAVVLAEELHFARAADRLAITQSALTKQIRELEGLLGIPLFERDKRHVEILPAGKVFVEESRLLLLHGERAQRLSRLTAVEEDRPLTVARSPCLEPEIAEALSATVLPNRQQLQIHFESYFADEIVRSVLNGSADFGIGLGLPREIRGLRQYWLRASQLHAVLPPGHPKLQQEDVSINDLRGSSFVRYRKEVNPWSYEKLSRVLLRERIEAPRVQHILLHNESIPLVRDQGYVAFANAYLAQSLEYYGLEHRPLSERGLRYSTVVLVRSENRSSLVQQVISAFVQRLTDRAPIPLRDDKAKRS